MGSGLRKFKCCTLLIKSSEFAGRVAKVWNIWLKKVAIISVSISVFRIIEFSNEIASNYPLKSKWRINDLTLFKRQGLNSIKYIKLRIDTWLAWYFWQKLLLIIVQRQFFFRTEVGKKIKKYSSRDEMQEDRKKKTIQLSFFANNLYSNDARSFWLFFVWTRIQKFKNNPKTSFSLCFLTFFVCWYSVYHGFGQA